MIEEGEFAIGLLDEIQVGCGLLHVQCHKGIRVVRRVTTRIQVPQGVDPRHQQVT